jgi:hypothetical protein
MYKDYNRKKQHVILQPFKAIIIILIHAYIIHLFYKHSINNKYEIHLHIMV